MTKPLIHVKFGCAHEIFDFLSLNFILIVYRAMERPEFYHKSVDELFYNRGIKLENDEPLIRSDEDDDENEQIKKKLPELNNEGKNAKKNIKINF